MVKCLQLCLGLGDATEASGESDTEVVSLCEPSDGGGDSTLGVETGVGEQLWDFIISLVIQSTNTSHAPGVGGGARTQHGTT